MSKLPFTIEKLSTAWGVSDVAYLDDGEDPTQALLQAVISAVDLDIMVTIGGVQESLNFWVDPESWQTEWAEKLNLGEDEDAVAAVYELLAGAVED